MRAAVLETRGHAGSTVSHVETLTGAEVESKVLQAAGSVDVDRDLDVARRFGVMSLPTVLFTRDGKEVERLDGLITEDALRAAFERAAHA